MRNLCQWSRILITIYHLAIIVDLIMILFINMKSNIIYCSIDLKIIKPYAVFQSFPNVWMAYGLNSPNLPWIIIFSQFSKYIHVSVPSFKQTDLSCIHIHLCVYLTVAPRPLLVNTSWPVPLVTICHQQTLIFQTKTDTVSLHMFVKRSMRKLIRLNPS